MWGNQELIRPISKAALRAVATPRLNELASSKKDHRGTSSFMSVTTFNNTLLFIISKNIIVQNFNMVVAGHPQYGMSHHQPLSWLHQQKESII